MKINAVIFGATGMVGRGVLIEALDHPDVESVLVIGRRACDMSHPKMTEILHDDFLDYSGIEDCLVGYNACFFCLGITSRGMGESLYRRITHDYAVAAAEVLNRMNPDMSFCFLSGAGADETLKSTMMWARVKGETENSLRDIGFGRYFVFRPAIIQPMRGVKPSFAFYRYTAPVFPLLKLLFRPWITTTVEVGRAMINAVLLGYKKQTLENRDIIKLSK